MVRNAPCKLCGKTAKLLKRSHIIPNFMYKGMFDDLNRMVTADLASNLANPRFQQTGFSEKYILCSKCDNELLGKLEKYTSVVLFGGKSKSPLFFESAYGPDGGKSIIIRNLDYVKFKLCILSILWRAHHSKHNFFKKIELQQDAEVIRRMLLDNEAPDETIFKISIIVVKNSEGLLRMVVDPNIIELGQGRVAIFLINGLFYFIEVKADSGFATFRNHFLRNEGVCEVLLIEGKQAKSFLDAYGLPVSLTDYYFST